MTFSARLAALLCWAGLFLLSSPGPVGAEETDADSPARLWKQTDRWRLTVDYFAPVAQKDAVSATATATFAVEVQPLDDPEKVALNGWTILRFTPADKAPQHLRSPIAAWVLKGIGWVNKAARINSGNPLPVDIKVLQIGSISVLLLSPAWQKIPSPVSDASQKRRTLRTLLRSVANQCLFQCGTQ